MNASNPTCQTCNNISNKNGKTTNNKQRFCGNPNNLADAYLLRASLNTYRNIAIFATDNPAGTLQNGNNTGILVGAYVGSYYDYNTNKITGVQYVNPKHMEEMGNTVERPGESAQHELIECFMATMESPMDAPDGTGNTAGYDKSHQFTSSLLNNTELMLHYTDPSKSQVYFANENTGSRTSVLLNLRTNLTSSNTANYFSLRSVDRTPSTTPPPAPQNTSKRCDVSNW